MQILPKIPRSIILMCYVQNARKSAFTLGTSMSTGMLTINACKSDETADLNSISPTKLCRIEDDKPNIDDLKAETSLHLTGPAEPRRRSARLLDLVQQFGKVSPPLKPEPAPSTASTDNLSPCLSLEIDETADVNRLNQRQEESPLSHPSPIPNGKRLRLWQCCNCRDSGMTAYIQDCCTCSHSRCGGCIVDYLRPQPKRT
jgi:hypothetical protein